MKVQLLLLLQIVSVLNIIALTNLAPEYQSVVPLLTIILGGWALMIVACATPGKASATTVPAQPVAKEPEPKKEVIVEPIKPEALPTTKQNTEAAAITFLGLLQEKGRFVDFLMEDVTEAEDAQLGSVARIVHEGCRSVLDECFDVKAVSTEAEGSDITVPVGYKADEFQLIGKVTGEAPFNGSLVHKGWRATKVHLPRAIETAGEDRRVIVPAQVEIK
ncbi:MAG: DUF2760 domain-containing protein [Candidatus Methylacidiphilales bacterium]|nr:DUF2760 domain-containing protein [Candidatus Methylacidiphilales bacterium]